MSNKMMVLLGFAMVSLILNATCFAKESFKSLDVKEFNQFLTKEISKKSNWATHPLTIAFHYVFKKAKVGSYGDLMSAVTDIQVKTIPEKSVEGYQGAEVTITLTGFADDSIRAEKYHFAFNFDGKKWNLKILRNIKG